MWSGSDDEDTRLKEGLKGIAKIRTINSVSDDATATTGCLSSPFDLQGLDHARFAFAGPRPKVQRDGKALEAITTTVTVNKTQTMKERKEKQQLAELEQAKSRIARMKQQEIEKLEKQKRQQETLRKVDHLRKSIGNALQERGFLRQTTRKHTTTRQYFKKSKRKTTNAKQRIQLDHNNLPKRYGGPGRLEQSVLEQMRSMHQSNSLEIMKTVSQVRKLHTVADPPKPAKRGNSKKRRGNGKTKTSAAKRSRTKNEPYKTSRRLSQDLFLATVDTLKAHDFANDAENEMVQGLLSTTGGLSSPTKKPRQKSNIEEQKESEVVTQTPLEREVSQVQIIADNEYTASGTFIGPEVLQSPYLPPTSTEEYHKPGNTLLDKLPVTIQVPSKTLSQGKFLKLDQSKLQLHLFDDPMNWHDENIEERIKLNDNGWSPFWEGKEVGWRWRSCKILSYIPPKDKTVPSYFWIKFNNNQRSKAVQRLNLLFDSEDIDKFRERVRSALSFREQAKSSFRFAYFIQVLSENAIRAKQSSAALTVCSIGGIQTSSRNNDSMEFELPTDSTSGMNRTTHEFVIPIISSNALNNIYQLAISTGALRKLTNKLHNAALKDSSQITNADENMESGDESDENSETDHLVFLERHRIFLTQLDQLAIEVNLSYRRGLQQAVLLHLVRTERSFRKIYRKLRLPKLSQQSPVREHARLQVWKQSTQQNIRNSTTPIQPSQKLVKPQIQTLDCNKLTSERHRGDKRTNIQNETFLYYKEQIARLHFARSEGTLEVIQYMEHFFRVKLKDALFVDVQVDVALDTLKEYYGHYSSNPGDEQLALPIQGFQLPTFQRVQDRQRERIASRTRLELRQGLLSRLLHQSVVKEFNTVSADRDTYNKSLLKPLLRVLRLRTAQHLQTLVIRSCSQWVQFIQDFVAKDGCLPFNESHDLAQHSFHDLVDNTLKSPSNRALFEVELVVDPETCEVGVSPTRETLLEALLRPLDAMADCVASFDSLDHSLLTLIETSPTPVLPISPQPLPADFQSRPSTSFTDLLSEQQVNATHKYTAVSDGTATEINYLIQSTNQTMLDAKIQIAKAITKSFTIATELLAKRYQHHAYLNRIDPKCYVEEYQSLIEEEEQNTENGTVSLSHEVLESYRKDVIKFASASKSVYNVSYLLEGCGLVLVSCESLRKKLSEAAANVAKTISNCVLDGIKSKNATIKEQFACIHTTIETRPTNEEELVALREYLNSLPAAVAALKDRTNQVHEEIVTLQTLQLPIDHEDFFAAWNLKMWPSKIELSVMESVALLEEERLTMMDQLSIEKEAFDEFVAELAIRVENFKIHGEIEQQYQVYEECREIEDDISLARMKATNFQNREELFGWAATEYFEVEKCAQSFHQFQQLWTLVSSFTAARDKWMNGSFLKLKAKDIIDESLAAQKKCMELVKSFEKDDSLDKPLQVALELKENIADFVIYIPVFEALASPALQHRHWVSISEIFRHRIVQDDTLTLQYLVDLNALAHIDKLMDVASIATKEHSLQQQLDNMVEEWIPIEFELLDYKHSQIVKVPDELYNQLDDHIAKVQTMLGSPFISSMKNAASEWERTLQLLQVLLDEWITLQRTWMYLEPIFGSEDMMRQMPIEGRRFKSVDNMWVKMMTKVANECHVLEVLKMDGIVETFAQGNSRLEVIQKGLNEYLETKRLLFPRFFFLSNDELLEILSQTKEPKSVQPHLGKCFEGVAHVTFSDEVAKYSSGEIAASEVTGDALHIVSFSSNEGETVSIHDSPVYVNNGVMKGNVEMWLLEFEKSMRLAVKRETKSALLDYTESETREQWVLKWPGMVILSVSCMFWTQQVRDAIEQQNLADYEKQLGDQLQRIVSLVRGDLTKLQRTSIGALCVMDVHARDVVTTMVRKGVETTQDFAWVSQLRYYWEEFIDSYNRYGNDHDNVVVRIVNSQQLYAYEYLGTTSRLVITPLTDRCYRTMMGAVALMYGGAPEGPAGTGKTETVKDLSKAVAIQCVVFNCSDGLDYLAMAKFFKGLASSGAWCCFDEFNRIELEVLSVIAQQILTMQQAKVRQAKHFEFEGSRLKLNPDCNTFITMNPGYAGRSELPDNLKALFRPCAMMVPDYAMIAEIKLYSFGFSDARLLANKIAQVLRLSSEQLSSQKHYDYGMRAVFSILVRAGNLRQMVGNLPDWSEDAVVLSAINDVNLPKFTTNDLPLFKGITRDLFPTATLPQPEYSTLLNAIHWVLKECGLQRNKSFVNSVIQLYETVSVRHGLMLVGEAMAGKSRVIQTLKLALSKCASDAKVRQKTTTEYSRTHTHIMNPKSITMGQLYGNFDPNTHEWTDGVLAVTYRKCARDSSGDRNWIIFDGPVDAVWIESMNTVLDENKKLCLPSGEIVKMALTTTMMFEAEDLEEASPATVSRVGMVYMEAERLGIKPLIASFLQRLPGYLQPFAASIGSRFHFMLPPLLLFIRKSIQLQVQVSDLQFTTSAISLFESFMLQVSQELDLVRSSGSEGKSVTRSETSSVIECAEGQTDSEGLQVPVVDSRLENIVAGFQYMAIVWSVGAVCDHRGRAQFDQFFHSLLVNPVELHKNKVFKFFLNKNPSYSYCELHPGMCLSQESVSNDENKNQESVSNDENKNQGSVSNDENKNQESISNDKNKNQGSVSNDENKLEDDSEPKWIWNNEWKAPFKFRVRSSMEDVTNNRELFNQTEQESEDRHTVFNYYFNPQKNSWQSWDTLTPEFKIPKDAQFHGILVPTIESIQVDHITESLLRNTIPVLFIGATGTGKTVAIKNLLTNLEPRQYQQIWMSLSARTNVNVTQDVIDRKCVKHRKGVFGPPRGKKFMLFVDDLNMPAKEEYGAQPPIELLRQWLDYEGWYDRSDATFRNIVDMQLICAMGYPGGGRTKITRRMSRHFNIINAVEFNKDSLLQVFGTIMSWFLGTMGDVPSVLKQTGELLVECSTTLYLRVQETLRPTPLKSHYVFNLRDLSRVLQGIVFGGTYGSFYKEKGSSTEAVQKDKSTLIKLWSHECLRVFSDRLVDIKDKAHFTTIMNDILDAEFATSWAKLSNTLGDNLLKVETPIANEKEPSIENSDEQKSSLSNSQSSLLDDDDESNEEEPQESSRKISISRGSTRSNSSSNSNRSSSNSNRSSESLNSSTTHSSSEPNDVELVEEEPAAKNVVDFEFRPALLYGNFDMVAGSTPEYKEYASYNELRSVINTKIDEYNSLNSNKLDLVLFVDALDHLTRVARILSLPNGHALLVGIGGSGRKSMATLGAFAADCKLYQIEITKAYGTLEWKEDLKSVLRIAGLEGKPTTFLLSDSQIINESFVEDINNILSSGEVPNLFAPEELGEIQGAMQLIAAQQQKGKTSTGDIKSSSDENVLDTFQMFVERCKQYLHIVLAFSPVGDKFRTRLRMFPSLVNCCTIDWYFPWPRDALQSVATRVLGGAVIPDSSRAAVVQICANMQGNVTKLSEKYAAEMQRHYYVTPTSYLELLNLFSRLLDFAKTSLATKCDRYGVGLQKLRETSGQVSDMQQELVALQPRLDVAKRETDAMLLKIGKMQVEANATREVITAEEHSCGIQANEAQAIKDECEQDLAEAVPVLKSAIQSLKTLSKNDIVEIKSMKKPPSGVKLTMEACCILLQVKPLRVANPNGKGKVNDYWIPAQKQLLADPKFLNRLMAFDKDNIPDELVERVKQYTVNSEFTPEVIKRASTAAAGICKWVHAMVVYDRLAKVVKPKREALGFANQKLEAAQSKLRAKQSELEQVEATLSQLQIELQATTDKKNDLEKQKEDCILRLDRARRLIDGLGGEKKRWTSSEQELRKQQESVVGDILLASGIVAYLGAFSAAYRSSCISDWENMLIQHNLSCSPQFSLSRTLADPVQIRRWTVHKLPSDAYSVDNGVMVYNSNRWPLMIDPQGQANRWVRHLEADADLVVGRQDEAEFVRKLEVALQSGTPYLLENIQESLDPVLENLLLKRTLRTGAIVGMLLGDNLVSYNPDFRLYITTKMSNPHYDPETCTKVNLLNFMSTSEGLEDQMLGIVVGKERPELEEQREQLIIQDAENKAKLSDIEDRILNILSFSSGNILDDETAINTLSESKTTSNLILHQVEKAAKTQSVIQTARTAYQPVALRAQLLFFAIANLFVVEPMYQYSLEWFIKMFKMSIDQTPISKKPGAVNERLKALKDQFTRDLFDNVSRSLFEKDKLLFSFQLCTQILSGESPTVSQTTDYDGDSKLGGKQTSPFTTHHGSKSTGTRPGMSAVVGSKTKARIAKNRIAKEPLLGKSQQHVRTEPKLSSRLLHFFLHGATTLEVSRPNPASSQLANLGGGNGPSGNGGRLVRSKSVRSMKQNKSSPHMRWLTDQVWSNLVELCKLLNAGDDLLRNIEHNLDRWSKVFDAIEPAQEIQQILNEFFTAPGHGETATILTGFELLSLLRCLRPDKLVPAVKAFTAMHLGQHFVEPSSVDLVSCFGTSTCTIPLLFVLTPGADPMAQLTKLAIQMGKQNQVVSVSLGQGQGPVAERVIAAGIDRGNWVVLQNVHLAESWMPALESICECIDEDRTDPGFRLWLTSMPSAKFPVSILQNSLKMTLEPPKGLKANMIHSYQAIEESWFESSLRPDDFKALLFSLCFFHAAVIERRKYGPLGWNIQYEFSTQDLKISLDQLLLFLNESVIPPSGSESESNERLVQQTYTPLPLETLRYLVGECNYGGRVTDDKDRRCLLSILDNYYNEQIVQRSTTHQYRFDKISGKYTVPKPGSLPNYIQHIQAFPDTSTPEVLGLHDNASITCALKDTSSLLQTALLLQPRDQNDGNTSWDQTVASLVEDVGSKIPPEFDIEQVELAYPVCYSESMNTVLTQELLRYNNLLQVVNMSLIQVRKALVGDTVLSLDLEQLGDSMVVGSVPIMWSSVAYPSLKPLGSWVTDLVARLESFTEWIEEGAPVAYWLSGFFFTQGFLTGTLQNFARRHQIPIDKSKFDFEVLPARVTADTITSGPKDGAFIFGLFLDGAGWHESRSVRHLDEPESRQLHVGMNMIWLMPVYENHDAEGKLITIRGRKADEDTDSESDDELHKQVKLRYDCPCYKTSERKGVLSTTGQSSNFVMNIALPVGEHHDPAHWIKRGVALLTQLDV